MENDTQQKVSQTNNSIKFRAVYAKFREKEFDDRFVIGIEDEFSDTLYAKKSDAQLQGDI